MSIFDASVRYRARGTPLLVLAGKEYGTGSSRDWAAKGPALQGVKAVIAESYERIHRSNLVGMGVLPLAYRPGENRESLGLTGKETFSITGIASGLAPGGTVTVTARDEIREGDGLPGRRPPQLGGGAGLLSPRWDPSAGTSPVCSQPVLRSSARRPGRNPMLRVRRSGSSRPSRENG